MAWYRRATPAWLLSIFIFFIVLFEFFIPNPTTGSLISDIGAWAQIIVTWLVWLGLVNIVRVYIREIRTRTPERWYFAIYGLVIMLVMIIFGFSSPDWTGWGRNETFLWMYTGLYMMLMMGHYCGQTLWCLAGIMRAYKARSLEALVFLVCGGIGMLTTSTVGGLISPYLPVVARWIVMVPAKGTFMALAIGLGIGMVVYTIRFIIGKEMTALGVTEEVTAE